MTQVILHKKKITEVSPEENRQTLRELGVREEEIRFMEALSRGDNEGDTNDSLSTRPERCSSGGVAFVSAVWTPESVYGVYQIATPYPVNTGQWAGRIVVSGQDACLAQGKQFGTSHGTTDEEFISKEVAYA